MEVVHIEDFEKRIAKCLKEGWSHGKASSRSHTVRKA